MTISSRLTQDDEDDDGPPVLSPIMPLLPENESEEHSGTTDRTRHKLSPMVSLSMAKDLEECEITEIPNDAENVSNAANFFAANNNDLPITWDENLDDNEIDNDDCNSDAGVRDVEKNEEFSKEYEKMEVNEGDDFEDSADENVVDNSREGDGDNQVHEVHNLDGTVLMVTNDAEGNQILIEQNVLDIDNIFTQRTLTRSRKRIIRHETKPTLCRRMRCKVVYLTFRIHRRTRIVRRRVISRRTAMTCRNSRTRVPKRRKI